MITENVAFITIFTTLPEVLILYFNYTLDTLMLSAGICENVKQLIHCLLMFSCCRICELDWKVLLSMTVILFTWLCSTCLGCWLSFVVHRVQSSRDVFLYLKSIPGYFYMRKWQFMGFPDYYQKKIKMHFASLNFSRWINNYTVAYAKKLEFTLIMRFCYTNRTNLLWPKTVCPKRSQYHKFAH